MASKKRSAKRPKKLAKKRSKTRRPARAKSRTRRTAARKAPRRKPAPRRRAAAPRAAAPPDRTGAVTHTELASADPLATRAWCERVLGWKFMEPMPTPTGPYHMWRFAIGTGGGIRANNPPEVPGSIPYCEVASIRATYDAALQAGATEMLSPQELPGGMGWIAIVAAPGGVPFGFWAMK
jgi:predicted enzyme related to lactoylglutathione lyase